MTPQKGGTWDIAFIPFVCLNRTVIILNIKK